MLLIPNVKEIKEGKKIEIKGCTFNFPENIDKRIVKIASKVPQGNSVVNFVMTESKGDEYKITFDNEITIEAGVKGAF